MHAPSEGQLEMNTLHDTKDLRTINQTLAYGRGVPALCVLLRCSDAQSVVLK